jgi:hypothetical protein
MVSYHFLSGEHGKKMIKIGVPCKKMLNFGGGLVLDTPHGREKRETTNAIDMRCYRDYCSNNYRLVLVSEPDGVLENAGTEYFSCGFGRGVAEKKYGDTFLCGGEY